MVNWLLFHMTAVQKMAETPSISFESSGQFAVCWRSMLHRRWYTHIYSESNWLLYQCSQSCLRSSSPTTAICPSLRGTSDSENTEIQSYLGRHIREELHWLPVHHWICFTILLVCSGSIVVTTLDPEVPGSSPEWVPIFYEARSTAQGLPEPSFLRGSTLGTNPVEHQDSNWVWIE